MHNRDDSPAESEERAALRARVAELERLLALREADQVRHQAETFGRVALLRNAERKYRLLIEHIPALTYISDLDNDSTTLYISPQIERIFGISAEEWMRDPTRWERMVHPEDRERALADLRLAQQTDDRVISEYRIITDSGRIVWLRDESVMVRDPEGRPEFLQGVVIDITDLKQAEQDRLNLERTLFQAQKLESLGVLAGGIAHDFNNLLTTILGNVGLAAMLLPEDSPAHEFLQQIRSATRQATGLTQQMLAYAGKGHIVIEPLNINAVIEEMGDLIKAGTPRTATLRYDLAPDLPMVVADATQIRQVFMNLIINAVEAIGEKHGMVTVRTWWEAAAPAEICPWVLVEVTDTGCGMDEATRRRIFEPFFTTKFDGRGLGLAAVLGIVRGHNGSLEVHSQLGVGTVFLLRLPALGTGGSPSDVVSRPSTETQVLSTGEPA